jgi:4-hydroxy-tetrahydrodipicolinate synthase
MIQKEMNMTVSVEREAYRTVQLVPLTAFDNLGELDLEPMRRQTKRLYDAGIRVFIPCAGSSEFHSLSNEEIIAAIEMTRSVVGADAKVVVPVGLQLRSAIQLGRRAVAAGADAMLVMPLSFPYISDVGARDYYRQLFDHVGCPAIIYKKDAVPSNELLLELAAHPLVLGVKYSMSDVTEFQQLLARDEGRLEWFCGHAERYAPFFMLAGASGYTSGAGNLCPRITLAMHRALQQGDYQAAFRWQKYLWPIEAYRARSNNSYNVTFLKYAMRYAGLEFGPPRPPYRQLTETERNEIDQFVPALLAAESELDS